MLNQINLNGRKLVVHNKNNIYLVSPNDIVLCKSDNCYTHILLKDGREIMICKSLTKISEELHSEHFLRISQSYLVNYLHVNSIDKKKKNITLGSNIIIPFTINIKQLVSLIKKCVSD